MNQYPPLSRTIKNILILFVDSLWIMAPIFLLSTVIHLTFLNLISNLGFGKIPLFNLVDFKQSLLNVQIYDLWPSILIILLSLFLNGMIYAILYNKYHNRRTNYFEAVIRATKGIVHLFLYGAITLIIFFLGTLFFIHSHFPFSILMIGCILYFVFATSLASYFIINHQANVLTAMDQSWALISGYFVETILLFLTFSLGPFLFKSCLEFIANFILENPENTKVLIELLTIPLYSLTTAMFIVHADYLSKRKTFVTKTIENNIEKQKRTIESETRSF